MKDRTIIKESESTLKERNIDSFTSRHSSYTRKNTKERVKIIENLTMITEHEGINKKVMLIGLRIISQHSSCTTEKEKKKSVKRYLENRTIIRKHEGVLKQGCVDEFGTKLATFIS